MGCRFEVGYFFHWVLSPVWGICYPNRNSPSMAIPNIDYRKLFRNHLKIRTDLP